MRKRPDASTTISLLGSFSLEHDGDPVPLGGPKQRAVLALLALESNRTVSKSRLIQDVWEEDAPATSRALETYVSNLRAVVAAVPGLEFHHDRHGYRLSVAPGTVDLDRFDQQAAAGRLAMREGRIGEAVVRFRAALDLVRGPPLDDLRDFRALAAAADQLESAVVAVREDRFEAEIRAGNHRLVVPPLQQLLREHPYRERVATLLVWSLYLDGRQAEAAEVYRSVRTRLIEDLGLEPGHDLRQMHQLVLEQAPSLLVPPAAGAMTATLPLTRHRLIDREQEVRQLVATLRERSARIVAVVGPGGCGKTRLAVEAAQIVAPSFADGVRFVDLAGVHGPEQFGAALAVALQAQPRLRETSSEAVRWWLASAEVLLVLDTFEHLLPAARQLADLLLPDRATTVLVTTRLPLGLRNASELRLGPLPLPGENAAPEAAMASPAVELFVQRARERAPLGTSPDEVADVAAICRQLDGLPLAIELAAARTDVLTPHQLREQLERDPRALRHAAADVPPRQRSLDDLLDWTYGLLPATAAELLTITGAFEGGFDLEALAAVAGDSWDTAQLLEAAGVLAGASLIDRDSDGRYGSLGTVHAYARQLLSEHPQVATIRRRHADHYLARIAAIAAAARTADESVAAATVRQELGNFHAAIRHAQAMREHVRAADCVLGLLRFWRREGRTELERLAVAELTQQFDQLPPDRQVSVASWAGTWFAERDRRQAERWLERAAALALELGASDPPYGMVLAQLAQVQLIGGLDERGLRSAEEAVAVLRGTVGVPYAFAQFAAGWAHACLGDLRRAAEVGRVSLGAAAGHGHWRCWPELLLARVAFLQGRHEEAVQLATEVLGTALAERDRPLAAAATAHLGWATYVAGDAASSLAWWRRTVRAAAEMDRPFTIANSLHGVASALAVDGDAPTALRLWGAADAIQAGIGVVDAHENRALYDDLRARLRAEFGERAQTLRATGAAMSIDEAVALACDG